MAVEKRFRDLLNENIADIRVIIKEKALNKYNENLDKLIDDWPVKELKDLKESYEDKIKQLNRQIDDLLPKVKMNEYSSWEERLIDPDTKDPLRQLWVKTKAGYNTSNMYEAEETVLLWIVSTPEYQTLINFNKIASQTLGLFNIAATNKEARNILLQFQNNDWGKLWVALPTLDLTSSFNITEWWNIVMKTLSQWEKNL